MQLNHTLIFLSLWQGGEKEPHRSQHFLRLMFGQKDPEYLLKNERNSGKQGNKPL